MILRNDYLFTWLKSSCGFDLYADSIFIDMDNLQRMCFRYTRLFFAGVCEADASVQISRKDVRGGNEEGSFDIQLHTV